MIFYCFDLKAKNTKEYNRLKRKFYYHLNKSSLASAPWKTKSVLAVSSRLEHAADTFFKRWRGEIEAYKINAKSVRAIG